MLARRIALLGLGIVSLGVPLHANDDPATMPTTARAANDEAVFQKETLSRLLAHLGGNGVALVEETAGGDVRRYNSKMGGGVVRLQIRIFPRLMTQEQIDREAASVTIGTMVNQNCVLYGPTSENIPSSEFDRIYERIAEAFRTFQMDGDK